MVNEHATFSLALMSAACPRCDDGDRCYCQRCSVCEELVDEWWIGLCGCRICPACSNVGCGCMKCDFCKSWEKTHVFLTDGNYVCEGCHDDLSECQECGRKRLDVHEDNECGCTLCLHCRCDCCPCIHCGERTSSRCRRCGEPRHLICVIPYIPCPCEQCLKCGVYCINRCLECGRSVCEFCVCGCSCRCDTPFIVCPNCSE